jgi:hypothetical protein
MLSPSITMLAGTGGATGVGAGLGASATTDAAGVGGAGAGSGAHPATASTEPIAMHESSESLSNTIPEP